MKIGGQRVFQQNIGFAHLLAQAYPEYNWLPWKFSRLPLNYWGDVNNLKKYLEWAAKELNIKEMDDLYKVSHQVKKAGK